MPASKRSVSSRRLNANRRNARKSTGPRTPRGKARSAANGLRHGLRSDRAFLPGENRKAYQDAVGFFARMFEPETTVEHTLARRIADALWMWFRCVLVSRGFGFLLAENPDALLRQIAAHPDPESLVPSVRTITRYRSRVIRRFGDDFARFMALRAARYGVDLSEVDPLPDPTDLLNNLAWAIALHLYADFPECFPDFTRDLLASVVPQLEGFLCPEDYAALTSRLHDSLQDGSAGASADASADASAPMASVVHDVAPSPHIPAPSAGVPSPMASLAHPDSHPQSPFSQSQSPLSQSVQSVAPASSPMASLVHSPTA